MRRPLLGLAAAFTAGCLVADRRESARETLALLTLAACAIGLAVAARRLRAAAGALAASALALGVAASALQSLALEAGALRLSLQRGALEGRVVRGVGRLWGDSVLRQGRLDFVLELEQAEIDGRATPVSGGVRVEVGGEAEKPRLLDGQRVASWFTLRLAPDDGSGLVGRGYCKSARLVERLPDGDGAWLRRLAAGLRERAREAFAHAMPPGTERGLVMAMVLGDRSEIDDGTSDAFKASGTYHVLALSGAQVALVAALLAGALRRLRCGLWLAAGLTTLGVAAYAGFVGGDPPVTRAALMAGAVLLARALEADQNAANLLGVAALLLLVAHPSWALDVGFQLSFGATLAIVALTAPLTRGLPRLPLRIELAMAASVAAQCALAPLLADRFHRLAPAALLLNIAAVPLSSAVLLGGFAILLATPLGAGVLVGKMAWLAARALRVSGDLGPAAPWLDVRVAGPGALALSTWLAGLALLLQGRRRLGVACLLATHVLIALGPLAPQADGRLHLAVVDVGQGDGLVLRSPSGRTIVVDAGGSRDGRFDPGERRMAPELWREGVRRLDAIVVSHAHPDHAGGVPYLLRAFRVSRLVEGPAAFGDASWRRLDAAVRAARLPRLGVVRGASVDWDGVKLRVLGPEPRTWPPPRVRNEDSVVLDVSLGEVHLLLAGDTGGAAEQALRPPASLVVKVPHHGSPTSSGATLVQATGPRLAIVSCGARNPFGHPNESVLDRWRAAGALVLRTDRDGTVFVATDGHAVWVRTALEGEERRIR
jgi:competence protein ComEC